MLKNKKVIAMFPMTIAVLLVAGFVLFSMSPVMNDIIIKNASAYTITANNACHLEGLEFYGAERSDAVDDDVELFYFQASGTTGNFVQTASNIRTTGFIREIVVTIDMLDRDWYDSIGYDGAGMNYTEWYPTTRILVTITNPNSVATQIYIFGGEDSITVTGQVYPNSSLISGNTWYCELDTPYVFSVAGTYTVSYALQVYY